MNEQYPNQDQDKLFNDIMDLIENSTNNHPSLVGIMLISIGTSLLIDLAPDMKTGMTLALDSMKTGVEDSKYGKQK